MCARAVRSCALFPNDPRIGNTINKTLSRESLRAPLRKVRTERVDTPRHACYSLGPSRVSPNVVRKRPMRSVLCTGLRSSVHSRDRGSFGSRRFWSAFGSGPSPTDRRAGFRGSEPLGNPETQGSVRGGVTRPDREGPAPRSVRASTTTLRDRGRRSAGVEPFEPRALAARGTERLARRARSGARTSTRDEVLGRTRHDAPTEGHEQKRRRNE